MTFKRNAVKTGVAPAVLSPILGSSLDAKMDDKTGQIPIVIKNDEFLK